MLFHTQHKNSLTYFGGTYRPGKHFGGTYWPGKLCYYFYVSNNLTDLPFSSKEDVHFHCTAFDYSQGDLDGFHYQIKDVPWEAIFTISVSAAISWFYEVPRLDNMYIYIWSSASSAVAIHLRNHFFCLHQHNKPFVFKLQVVC